MTERRWGLDRVSEADIVKGGFSTPWMRRSFRRFR